jgi:hypothetical protein
VLRERHPNTLTIISNLVSTYWNLRQYDKALDLQLKVLYARKEVLRERHLDTLKTTRNLALMSGIWGRMTRLWSWGWRY